MASERSSFSAIRAQARGPSLSDDMLFGLGAGLYFEYRTQPSHSPSRVILGHSRRLEDDLLPRLAVFASDPRAAVLSALRLNALNMDLDRSPYTAIMGMELLCDDFENWAGAPDASDCARQAAAEIRDTKSLYRRRYVRFLEEASAWVADTHALSVELASVAGEWDNLARELADVAGGEAERSFGRAGLLLRRIALVEEHFWGTIIDLTNSRVD